MSDHFDVIAIDGPAGAGKSTVAKKLAQRLNFFYLDTGAMYRALTLKALRQGVPLDSENQLTILAQQTVLDLVDHPRGIKIILDGEDVSEAIRTLEVTNQTFYIARAPKVREILVEWQRTIGRNRNVVLEGRDTGTVVFPKAKYKFYLDANVDVRARRRSGELIAKGQPVDEQKIKIEINERDQKDLTRKVGPLKKAHDAIFIDTTDLSVDKVVEEMLKHIHG